MHFGPQRCHAILRRKSGELRSPLVANAISNRIVECALGHACGADFDHRDRTVYPQLRLYFLQTIAFVMTGSVAIANLRRICSFKILGMISTHFLVRSAVVSLLFLTAICACAPAYALEAKRIFAPIVLDGKLSEAAWASAPASDQFIENLPQEKTPAKVKTEVRILYDDLALYVGVRAYDPEPSKIVAPLVRRDRVYGTQDNFNIWIDPTGARKFAQFFRVNPRGVLADGVWNEDQTDEDFSPDYEYEAVPALLADGWSAEFRIPWTTLRMPSPAPAQLSFIAFRNMMRETRIRMSNVSLGREPPCFLCVAEPLTGITSIPSAAGISVSPYLTLLTGAERVNREKTRKKSDMNVGVDLKWRVNSDWVIDATLLPDFSQLESDAPVLRANSLFAISLQEKRPFFLEGSDLYSTPLNTFYSRAIADPKWGTRATLRSESLDATILTVADRGGSFTILPNTFYSDGRAQPASQVTLARARIPFKSEIGGGSLGFTLTDRDYADTTRNTMIAADVALRPTDAWRIRGQIMGSESREIAARNHGHMAFLESTYDDGKWRKSLKYVESSPQFRADASINFQNGFREMSGGGAHCVKREGFLNEICTGLESGGQKSWDGTTIGYNIVPTVNINGARNLYWNVQPRYFNYTRTRPDGPLHHVPYLSTYFNFVPGQIVSAFEAGIGGGRDVDVVSDVRARSISGNTLFTVRPMDRLELEWRSNVFMLHDLGNGQLRLRDTAHQLVAVGYISALDTVRLIAAHTQTVRNLSQYRPDQGLEPKRTSIAASVLYAHKWSLGKELNIGVTFNRDTTNRESAISERRSAEAFVKWVWTFTR